MKKLRLTFISVISLILILLGSVSVSAKNNEYYLKELGMTIEISDTLSVKTRESSDLPKGTYLEAANDDKSMTLVIEMDKNENSKEVDSFANQSSAYLEKYKANLENMGINKIDEAEYGYVTFLDFKRSFDQDGDTKPDLFELHSITCFNGMIITVVSKSAGDNFESDELALIKSSLESIRFDTIEAQQQEAAEKTTKTWITVIVIILVAVALTIAGFILYKKKKRKKLVPGNTRKDTNYDVLKQAEISNRKPQQNTIGGYKTSTDYFQEDFDNSSTPTLQNSSVPENENNSSKKASAFTRMGYFKKNLSREISKAKAQKKNKKQNSKGTRKTVDYDIFNEK